MSPRSLVDRNDPSQALKHRLDQAILGWGKILLELREAISDETLGTDNPVISDYLNNMGRYDLQEVDQFSDQATSTANRNQSASHSPISSRHQGTDSIAAHGRDAISDSSNRTSHFPAWDRNDKPIKGGPTISHDKMWSYALNDWRGVAVSYVDSTYSYLRNDLAKAEKLHIEALETNDKLLLKRDSGCWWTHSVTEKAFLELLPAGSARTLPMVVYLVSAEYAFDMVMGKELQAEVAKHRRISWDPESHADDYKLKQRDRKPRPRIRISPDSREGDDRSSTLPERARTQSRPNPVARRSRSPELRHTSSSLSLSSYLAIEQTRTSQTQGDLPIGRSKNVPPTQSVEQQSESERTKMLQIESAPVNGSPAAPSFGIRPPLLLQAPGLPIVCLGFLGINILCTFYLRHH